MRITDSTQIHEGDELYFVACLPQHGTGNIVLHKVTRDVTEHQFRSGGSAKVCYAIRQPILSNAEEICINKHSGTAWFSWRITLHKEHKTFLSDFGIDGEYNFHHVYTSLEEALDYAEKVLGLSAIADRSILEVIPETEDKKKVALTDRVKHAYDKAMKGLFE